MSMLNEAKRGSLTDDRDRSLVGRLKDIIPWKGDDLKEILRKIVFICAICVLVYSAYDAYIYKFGSKEMIDTQKDLSDLYHNGGATTNMVENTSDPAVTTPTTVESDSVGIPDADNTPQNQYTAPETSKYPVGMLASFEPLYDINPDIIGWISIDGIYIDDSKPEDELELAINYPVLQCEDNDYYLSHDIYKSEVNYGALFLDYRADVYPSTRSDNLTIYGHNMGSGYYFARLHDYKKGVQFLSDHRVVNFDTLYSQDKYIIFGAFLISANEEDDNLPIFRYHNVVNFNNDLAQFDYWFKNVMYRSYYYSDIECTLNDEYLSLSTCSTEISDSRFVIVARKLREGEDPSVYTYRENKNARKPAKFYYTYGYDVPKDNGPDYEFYIPD